MDHLKLQASARQRASDYIHARARNRIDKQSSTLGDATSAPSRACHGISAGWPQPTERGARVLTIRGVGEGRGGGEQGAEHRHGEEVARRRHSNPSRAHPANPPRRSPAKSWVGSGNPERGPEQGGPERCGSFRGTARLRHRLNSSPNSAPTREIALGSRTRSRIGGTGQP
jgi:hypothetical protein